MLESATLAALAAFLKPIAEAFFSAFGTALNNYLAAQRADQNAKDLGAAEAKLDTANSTIAAQQAELQAQADAPKGVSDALKRLEEGSA